MSDQTGMNDDSAKPDEMSNDLKKLESALARMALPASKLDRDELMYQAGWAAAMAERDSRNEVATNASPKSSSANVPARGWAWPMATLAATAASILFCGLFVWQTMNNSGANFTANKEALKAETESVEAANSNLSDPANAEAGQPAAENKPRPRDNLVDLVMDHSGNKKLAVGFVMFEDTVDDSSDERTRLPPMPQNRFELRQELLSAPFIRNPSSFF